MEGLTNLWQKVPRLWRWAGPGIVLALGLVALLQGRSDGRLHLYFLDVGSGNALLVVTPSGRSVLIDGGPDRAALLTGLGRYLPFWQRHLDLVLLTETASERMAGPVVVMERYRVRAAAQPVRVCPGPGEARWRALLAQEGQDPLHLQRGESLDLGDGVIVEILHPPADPLPGTTPGDRDDALVLRLRYGGFSALLPTAAGPAVQQALLEAGADLPSTIVLIPRQAEHNALDRRFLLAVDPAAVVASVGSGYHQDPDARTLGMVLEAGVPIYRTDRQGTIEVATDGEVVVIKQEK